MPAELTLHICTSLPLGAGRLRLLLFMSRRCVARLKRSSWTESIAVCMADKRWLEGHACSFSTSALMSEARDGALARGQSDAELATMFSRGESALPDAFLFSMHRPPSGG